MRRRREQLAFNVATPAPVIAWMDRMQAAQDGWLNLRAEVPDDEDEAPFTPRPGPFAFLGGRQTTDVVCTWMPARPDHRVTESSVGIMHPRGRGAVARLAAAGVALPEGWRATQDHARRGLIVKVPANAESPAVFAWMVAAAGQLALESTGDRWQAEVFAPAESS